LISHESNPTEGINWALFCDTDRSLYLRCSRPLCSSQNTGGILRARARLRQQQDPEVRRYPRITAGPSGPNSVQKTRSLVRILSNWPKPTY